MITDFVWAYQRDALWPLIAVCCFQLSYILKAEDETTVANGHGVLG